MPWVTRSPGQNCKKGSRWDRKQQYWLRRWHPSLSAWARASFSFCLNTFLCSYEKQNYSFRLIFFQSVIFGSSTITQNLAGLFYIQLTTNVVLGWLSICNLWTQTFFKWYKCNFSFWIPISIHLICRARSFSYLSLPHIQTQSSMENCSTHPWTLQAGCCYHSHMAVFSSSTPPETIAYCSKRICYSLPSSAAG